MLALLLSSAVPYYNAGDEDVLHMEEEQLQMLLQHSLRQTVLRSLKDENQGAIACESPGKRPPSSQPCVPPVTMAPRHQTDHVRQIHRQMAIQLRRIADRLEEQHCSQVCKKRKLSLQLPSPSGVMCVCGVVWLFSLAAKTACHYLRG